MTDIQDRLSKAFDYTTADLTANRDGRLTTRQQEILGSGQNFWKVAALTMLVVVVATAFAVIGILSNATPVTDIRFIPVAFLIMLVIAVVFLVSLFSHQRKIRVAIVAGHVIPVHGELHITEPEVGTIGRFRVQTYNFNDLSQEQFDIIRDMNETRNPSSVTVYCVPNHHKVLSIDIHSDVANTL